MKKIGYYLEDSLICVACYDYWLDRMTTTRDSAEMNAIANTLSKAEEADREALPDGFTCADCGEVFI
ncbi:MAG: hypothetical protein ACO3CH_00110 [Ilumatobacteraceae bacterium]|nr:hypothetical protein [Chitinophagales bacterium]